MPWPTHPRGGPVHGLLGTPSLAGQRQARRAELPAARRSRSSGRGSAPGAREPDNRRQGAPNRAPAAHRAKARTRWPTNALPADRRPSARLPQQPGPAWRTNSDRQPAAPTPKEVGRPAERPHAPCDGPLPNALRAATAATPPPAARRPTARPDHRRPPPPPAPPARGAPTPSTDVATTRATADPARPVPQLPSPWRSSTRQPDRTRPTQRTVDRGVAVPCPATVLPAVPHAVVPDAYAATSCPARTHRRPLPALPPARAGPPPPTTAPRRNRGSSRSPRHPHGCCGEPQSAPTASSLRALTGTDSSSSPGSNSTAQ